ncbi:KpsF/GutQ family sugar-phosphate isomerase [candidate division WOR-3 bacterium]|nr:KpsF/GutQ family sugar-phosphate isomerase [candidate division WOR-3 bacterium]TET77371.1 MAG: KpsF/GutQ family sugar-phosphate isomerase [Candidatus Cloacimonadota bacterium]
MKKKKEIIKKAKEIVKKEADELLSLQKRIGGNFVKAVEAIYNCKGKVIVSGIGKSGIIGRKIAATLSSTGTPAFHLHPTEGIHGDVGLVTKNDVVIAISKSGETEELFRLIPTLKRIGAFIIAFTGNSHSTLAKQSDVVLDISVDEEACPYNLVPTSSTAVTLALGDALALCLFHLKNLKPKDFALFHPGGSIGRKLLTKVEDVMLTGSYVPIVPVKASMKETILEMTSKRGITTVIDSKGKITGVITDGDLRRLLEKRNDIFKMSAGEIMTFNPRTVKKEELAINAVKLMEAYGITSIPVVNTTNRPIGIIHLHDLMRLGIV